MKFGLGKTKLGLRNSVEQETISRWREAAMKVGESRPTENAAVDFVEELDRAQPEWPHQTEPHVTPVQQQPVPQIQQKHDAKIFGFGKNQIEPADVPSAQVPTREQPVQSSFPTHGLASRSTTMGVSTPQSESPEETELSRRFGSQLRTALGRGTVIQGKLTFDAPVRIDGTLTGEVHSTSTLVVGHKGTIQANVEVGSLVVYGRVIGPVNVTDTVEIRRGGSLEGDISTDRVLVEEGGYFDGHCSMR